MTVFPSSGPAEPGIPPMTGDPLKSTGKIPIFHSHTSSEKRGQEAFRQGLGVAEDCLTCLSGSSTKETIGSQK